MLDLDLQILTERVFQLPIDCIDATEYTGAGSVYACAVPDAKSVRASFATTRHL